MGAWGAGAFENDDAADWLADLEENAATGLDVIDEALGQVMNATSDAEAPDCSVALAAAEVVAACTGKPAANLPEEVTAFVSTKPELAPAMVDAARTAVQKIFSGSELCDLWEESDRWEEWEDAIGDLLDRLGQRVSL